MGRGGRGVVYVDEQVGRENLRKVWTQVRDWEREAGEVYWHKTLIRAHGLAERYGVHVHVAAAVFCVLSPNNSEAGNWKDAEAMLAQGEGATVHSYPLNKVKALAILHGADPQKLLGKKTASMWANICTPDDPWPVTVDGHMLSVWQGERLTMDQASLTPKQYKVIAQAVRELAGEQGRLDGSGRALTGGQMQAMLWMAWKRIHRILYKPQLKFDFTDTRASKMEALGITEQDIFETLPPRWPVER